MVHWVKSSGEVMTVHQPELRAASAVRNEVTTIPMVGTTHRKQITSRKILTTELARPWRAPAAPAPGRPRGMARRGLTSPGTGVGGGVVPVVVIVLPPRPGSDAPDRRRKSTRLNSSHT